MFQEDWPSTSILQMDESQRKAFISALTKEFVLIQGPPGTGKTHLGLQIAKALLHNSNKWLQEDSDIQEDDDLQEKYQEDHANQFGDDKSFVWLLWLHVSPDSWFKEVDKYYQNQKTDKEIHDQLNILAIEPNEEKFTKVISDAECTHNERYIDVDDVGLMCNPDSIGLDLEKQYKSSFQFKKKKKLENKFKLIFVWKKRKQQKNCIMGKTCQNLK
ncbi:unnamed protein product [Mytilus edulis]|uniref:DNA2/NAM7 helicase helicase domain-containing protein n=1 Tax=Mytilus edulis TaxID=6550 RepID=A0A8S3QJV8_MYTED|nr:unnamed protein product [Mytilus edulis]